MIAVVFAGLGFCVAAFAGGTVARAMYAGRSPFDDGPRSIVVEPWIVALCAMIVGMGLAAHGASALQLATVAIVVAALAACTITDFQIGIVPDLFTLVPLAALLLSSSFHGNFTPFLGAVIVAFPFAGAALLSHGRGMGWGDVKLAALAGALLGARDATIAITIACVAAFVISKCIGIRGRPIPFAPYIVAGIGFVLMMGATA